MGGGERERESSTSHFSASYNVSSTLTQWSLPNKNWKRKILSGNPVVLYYENTDLGRQDPMFKPTNIYKGFTNNYPIWTKSETTGEMMSFCYNYIQRSCCIKLWILHILLTNAEGGDMTNSDVNKQKRDFW